jgi:phosphoribosylformylglycinamidine synthase I
MSRIGIIRYPGSNCDQDTFRYFDTPETPCFYIWHKETKLPENLKMLIIPGGFAFGDRLYEEATGQYTISPGTMALMSPVTQVILEAVENKIPILGICNGFQILTGLGLLPGKLLLNENKKFTCKRVSCSVNCLTKQGFHLDKTQELYIANSFGKYSVEEDTYTSMKQKQQIFLTYNNEQDVSEVNSLHNIAGVSNESRTIFGMMPHPERNNTNFLDILNKLLFSEDYPEYEASSVFEKKITDLLCSEHISYKSTRKYLKKFHTQEPWVVQGPGENAGIIDIGDGYCLAMRIESHNHPTFINPFEGAATGVGGILRDIMAMGARPIGILDFLRFGTNEHSRNLLSKTIDGISYYGNCFGVANVGGDLYKHKSFDKNPLVNVACMGIVKKENIIYGNARDEGDLLVYVGSKTGNEGIGGAAMASQSFSSTQNMDTLQNNVQKSDPFLERLLLEACCEIAEQKLAIGMQDLGAGGLLCASYEVVHRASEKYNKKLGCRVNINAVPLKHKMKCSDILISESQERMLIVCNQEQKQKIFDIFEKWDLEYAVVGEVNTSGNYSVYHNDVNLFEKSMSFFADVVEDWEVPRPQKDLMTAPQKQHNMELWKVYDSTIGNRTLKGPDQPNSHAILDIYEIGKKLHVSWGTSYDECNEYFKKNTINPLALVNCLNYGHPQTALGDLVNLINVVSRRCKEDQIPVIGGNVSLYNSTDGKNIYPTPVLVMVGVK